MLVVLPLYSRAGCCKNKARDYMETKIVFNYLQRDNIEFENKTNKEELHNNIYKLF
jgi:hypothetical protein